MTALDCRSKLPAASWAGALLLALLAGCGGGDPSDPARPGPHAESGGALRVAGQGEIATYFRARIQRMNAQGGHPLTQPGLAMPTTASAPASAEQSTYAGAPLQEQGVDEEDLLKASGSMLYSLHQPRWQEGTRRPGALAAARVLADGALASLARQDFPAEQVPQGMYLADEIGRLAVLTQKHGYGVLLPTLGMSNINAPSGSTIGTPPAIGVHLYRTSPLAAPAAQQTVELDGRLLGSRRIGNVLYVVSTWTPSLSGHLTAADGTQELVKAALSKLDSAALLPSMRINGGAAQPLVQEPSCLLQPDNASLALQITTITVFDLATPDVAPNSRCLVGDSNAIYMSRESLYLATSRQAWVAGATSLTVFPDQTSTDIHKFALEGTRVEYRGSGQVRGHLGWEPDKVAQRMSEYEGNLRILSFTGQTGRGAASTAQATPSPATLSILREDTVSRSLVNVASLPNSARPGAIGHPGEQVHGVHFAGPRAYVVTFRRTDPLYVLDLSTPSDPKVAGELNMPGYSDYLFPLADGQLLGVGRDASLDGVVAGIKVALFDVKDAAQPRLQSQLVMGGRGSYSALEHSRRGISILPVGNRSRIALPVWLSDAAGNSGAHGLARLEANLASGTLVNHTLVAAPSSNQPWGTLAAERALQSVHGSYYLTGDQVIYSPLP